MCKQRHKTAYGRQQLQIGQQTVLYRYKMHESTEDPRSTPLTACLGFSFWTKQPRFLWRALEEHLRELRSDWSRSEWELEWGHEARVGQNRECGFTSKGACNADWSVPSCTEQTLAMTRWRRGGWSFKSLRSPPVKLLPACENKAGFRLATQESAQPQGDFRRK